MTEERKQLVNDLCAIVDSDNTTEKQITVGSHVRCGVFVLGKWVPMHSGIVMRDHGDDTCDVDRMGLHGGRPWVVREQFVRPLETEHEQ